MPVSLSASFHLRYFYSPAPPAEKTLHNVISRKSVGSTGLLNLYLIFLKSQAADGDNISSRGGTQQGFIEQEKMNDLISELSLLSKDNSRMSAKCSCEGRTASQASRFLLVLVTKLRLRIT